MTYTTNSRQSLTSKIKVAIRDSAALRAAQKITNPIVRRWPVENLPNWLAKLHGIRAPKGVRPFATPSPLGGANIKIILSLAKSVLHLDGDLAECGVYRGATIIPLGLYLNQNKIDKTVFAFDSFEGFGDLARVDLAEGAYIRSYGSCEGTSYEMLQGKLRGLGLLDRIVVTKGYFNETLDTVKSRRFCFVHLDCDLYQSYKDCLTFFYPRLVREGVLLLDEYNDTPCPGCNKAVDEFLIGKPEQLAETLVDNVVRYFIRKRT